MGPACQEEMVVSMRPNLTHKDFEAFLNQKIKVHHGTVPLEFALIESRRLNSAGRPDDQREPFYLLFRGPILPILPQRMYKFDFGELGILEMFIVPIGPEGDGMRYEAVFA